MNFKNFTLKTLHPISQQMAPFVITFYSEIKSVPNDEK